MDNYQIVDVENLENIYLKRQTVGGILEVDMKLKLLQETYENQLRKLNVKNAD
tara:strand:- start:110 stop:268 length:159 start_codon:yes stop_codon:yes gene_type:complete